MATIAEKIDQIIAQRKAHVGPVEEQMKEITRLKNDFENFKSVFDDLKSKIDDVNGEYNFLRDENLPEEIKKKNNEFIDKVKHFSYGSISEALTEFEDEGERLKNRFNRDKISISVIGKARQGKSTLLQSISGLRGTENSIVIPTASETDCTGAKSIICNSPKFSVTIRAFTKMELMNAVQKYLDFICPSYKLHSIDDVKNLDLHKIEEALSKEQSPDKIAKFKHLKKYKEHFEDYSDYLGSELKFDEHTDPTIIEEYVAQYSQRDHEKKYYKYLGVKEAEICTEFKEKGVGKIELVDTIGLGDTSIGIQDKLIETLKNNSDAAIVVRMAEALGDALRQEDLELYEKIIKKNMGERAIDKWLFYAINVPKPENEINGKNIINSIKSNSNFKIADAILINCANEEEVGEKLVIPMLNKLSENLHDVDNEFLYVFNNRIEMLKTAVDEIKRKIEDVIECLDIEGVEDDISNERYRTLFNELSESIGSIKKKWLTKRGEKCEGLEQRIHELLKKKETNPDGKDDNPYCPTKDEIKKKLKYYNQESRSALDNFLDEVGRKIYDDFIGKIYADGDEGFAGQDIKGIENSHKAEILDKLYYVGKLGRINIPNSEKFNDLNNEKSDQKKEDLLIEWFDVFYDEIIKKDKSQKVLQEVLGYLYQNNFGLDIRGLLQYKINRALSTIDFDDPNCKKPNIDNINDEEKKCNIIYEFLKKNINNLEALLLPNNFKDKVRSYLSTVPDADMSEFLKIPNYNFYSKLISIRAKLIIDENGDPIKRFWKNHKREIWKEEFENVEKKEYINKEFKDFIGKLEGFKLNSISL